MRRCRRTRTGRQAVATLPGVGRLEGDTALFRLHRFEFQYILYGMGFRTDWPARASDLADDAGRHFHEAARLGARMRQLLPTNRELLEHVARHGFPRA